MTKVPQGAWQIFVVNLNKLFLMFEYRYSDKFGSLKRLKVMGRVHQNKLDLCIGNPYKLIFSAHIYRLQKILYSFTPVIFFLIPNTIYFPVLKFSKQICPEWSHKDKKQFVQIYCKNSSRTLYNITMNLYYTEETNLQ